jgi:hypothetical protein
LTTGSTRRRFVSVALAILLHPARSHAQPSTSPEDRDAQRFYQRAFEVALWSIAGALAFWRSGYAIFGGTDLWWHLATGRWVVEHGSIPHVEPWSFTAADNRWVVDAWLSDVILYLWSELFGLQSLVWWKWTVLIATFLVLMRLLWRLGGSALPAYLVAALAAALATPFLGMRPQMHTLLCLAIFLELTVERERPCWALPLLFVAWANLHAGFALGLLLLPLVWWPHLVRRQQRTRALCLLLACFAACLLNPNGYHAFAQPLIYALQTDSSFQTLSEWGSPFGSRAIPAPLYPFALALFGIVVVFQLARLARKRPVPWVTLLVGLSTATMSVRSQKFITVFAIGSSLLLVQTLAPLLRRPIRKIPSVPAAAVAIVSGLILLAPYPQQSYAFHFLTSEYSLPIETVHFIETNELAGRVFAYYQWGGYLDYRTRGRFSVFIDPRASAVFDEDTLRQYIEVGQMRPGWMEILNDSEAEFFLWPLQESAQIQALLGSDRWRPVYSDSRSVLLARRGVELPNPLVPTADSAYKQLALGWEALNRRQYDLARAHIAATLEKIPYECLACTMLINTHVEVGDLEKAKQTVRRCERLFPGAFWEEVRQRALSWETMQGNLE